MAIKYFIDYRNRATTGYSYNELVDYGYDDNEEVLIPLSTIESVINDIESDVKYIESLLDCISGLTEIDEIKQNVNELATKLF